MVGCNECRTGGASDIEGSGPGTFAGRSTAVSHPEGVNGVVVDPIDADRIVLCGLNGSIGRRGSRRPDHIVLVGSALSGPSKGQEVGTSVGEDVEGSGAVIHAYLIDGDISAEAAALEGLEDETVGVAAEAL